VPNNNPLRGVVYGLDSFDYVVPQKPRNTSKYTLDFEEITTSKDFAHYDLVIFLSRTFESTDRNGEIVCTNKLELQKRVKQLFKLISKGGYVCILVDSIRDEKYFPGNYSGGYTQKAYDTSLSKVFLNDCGIDSTHRKYSDKPLRHYKIFRDEFKKYLDDYGITHTVFSLGYEMERDVVPICKTTNYHAGLLLNNLFLLPFMSPDKTADHVSRLFSTIADAISNALPKLTTEVPQWVKHDYVFPNELTVIKELNEMHERINLLNDKIRIYDKFKSCITLNSSALVSSISFLMTSFFEIGVSADDNFNEDLKLIDPKTKACFAIAEVKGVNGGVTRENINQVDSHREKLGYAPSFPALLFVNVRMNATSIEDKYLEVASEQIKKAVSDNVLIVRTIDLLYFVVLVEKGLASKSDFIKMLHNEKGWLRVTDSAFEIKDS